MFFSIIPGFQQSLKVRKRNYKKTVRDKRLKIKMVIAQLNSLWLCSFLG